jgi:hypothetical protein
MCNRTCMYPCADGSAGNGHRRLDEGNGVMAMLSNAVHVEAGAMHNMRTRRPSASLIIYFRVNGHRSAVVASKLQRDGAGAGSVVALSDQNIPGKKYD